jgi:hypothetical protein
MRKLAAGWLAGFCMSKRPRHTQRRSEKKDEPGSIDGDSPLWHSVDDERGDKAKVEKGSFKVKRTFYYFVSSKEKGLLVLIDDYIYILMMTNTFARVA